MITATRVSEDKEKKGKKKRKRRRDERWSEGAEKKLKLNTNEVI